jgi:hypothetical protein
VDANCLDIGDTAYPPIELHVPAGTRVSGTAVGSNGKPLAKMQLDADASTITNSTMTDAKGRFSMLLIPGKYFLYVESEQGTLAGKKITVGKTPITGLRVGGG